MSERKPTSLHFFTGEEIHDDTLLLCLVIPALFLLPHDWSLDGFAYTGRSRRSLAFVFAKRLHRVPGDTNDFPDMGQMDFGA
jgi:hypothetical protein